MMNMDKFRIRIDNFLLSLRSFEAAKTLQGFLLLEGVILVAALTGFLFQMNAVPRYQSDAAGISRISSIQQEEIKIIPSGLFYGDKHGPVPKAQLVFPKLNLTGAGTVKGVFKASIEDAQGNYYYVREGETVKGMTVKKISSSMVELRDKAGNLLVLKLDR